jgi:hypothetical protein
MKCPNHPSNDVVNHYLIKVNNTGKHMLVGTCCFSCANEISKSLVTGNGKYTLKDGKYLMKNGKQVQLLQHKSKSRKLTKGKFKTKKSTSGKSKKRKFSKKLKVKKLNKMVGGVNVSDLIDTEKVSDEMFKKFIKAFIKQHTEDMNNNNSMDNKNTPMRLILNFDNTCYKLNTTDIELNKNKDIEMIKNYCDLLFINIYMYLKKKSINGKNNNNGKNIKFKDNDKKIKITNPLKLFNEFDPEISKLLQNVNNNNNNNINQIIEKLQEHLNTYLNTNTSKDSKKAFSSDKLMIRFLYLYLKSLNDMHSKSNNDTTDTTQKGGFIIALVGVFFAVFFIALFVGAAAAG